MTRPLLLDLFCGAGGAAMGYHRAGFEIIGVDIEPQPRYPFRFIQGDAMDYLTPCMTEGFAAIHASPPCQAYSSMTPAHTRDSHPDSVPPTRAALMQTGLPWVIENVPGAPIRADFKLCACMFGLRRLRRQRWFETWPQLFDLRTPCRCDPHPLTITTTNRGVPLPERLSAMGIDWMDGYELGLAIPPAYTEYIGRQLLDHLKVTA